MESAGSRVRLVAGLGNPGAEYALTRHNVGFMVVDRLADQLGVRWEKSTKWEALTTKIGGEVLLAKPTTFMNHSGYPLHALAQFYKIFPQQILVILDDFALPLGRLRIRPGGGTAGHNGLESIIVQFASDEIPRLRVGIGGAAPHGAIDHVLGRFFEEEKLLVRSSIDRAVEAVKCVIDKGLVSAMNSFNAENLGENNTKET